MIIILIFANLILQEYRLTTGSSFIDVLKRGSFDQNQQSKPICILQDEPHQSSGH